MWHFFVNVIQLMLVLHVVTCMGFTTWYPIHHYYHLSTCHITGLEIFIRVFLNPSLRLAYQHAHYLYTHVHCIYCFTFVICGFNRTPSNFRIIGKYPHKKPYSWFLRSLVRINEKGLRTFIHFVFFFG